MMRTSWRAAWLLAAALSVLSASPAAARPNYFSTFTGIYGLVPGDDLYSCGVCHRTWTGTGARNPFGIAVEQQLYIGKTITDSILAVEPDDTDGDGFTNVDEITVHQTLPGYSCDNYTLVINPPPTFQSMIEPGVPSCLEPKDILIDPTPVELVIQVNQVGTEPIEIVNNGTDFPITVSSYGMVAGSHPALSVSGPAVPFVIPVGSSVTVNVVFSPTASAVAFGTFRVSSDDPDEPDLDLLTTGIGFVKNIAPASERAACMAETQKRYEQYSRTHLREWGRCYVDEIRGLACNTGRRDLKIAQAQAKLRAFVGGAKDRHCAGNGLSPSRLDLPVQCAAPCESITLSSISAWADCLVCRQDSATNAMLDAAVGTHPPDLPASSLGFEAQKCGRTVVKALQNGIRRMQKTLGACDAANITAAVPVDCAATTAASIADEAERVDQTFERCFDSAGLESCRSLPGADPDCLGDAAGSISDELTDTVFETR
jgi:hypothetical protein